MVCMITHKRSFDQPATGPEGQQFFDQCVLRIEQKFGFIYDFSSNGSGPSRPDQNLQLSMGEDVDGEPTEDDWFYEFKF